jgi:hypothetical protein
MLSTAQQVFMRFVPIHFIWILIVSLFLGCGQSVPEPVATLYKVDTAVYAVHFSVKETSYGDRHNPFILKKNVRSWSFWVVVPESTGKIKMSQADIVFKPPLPGHKIEANSRDGWILISGNKIELEMQIPTSSFNGTYSLKSAL